MNKVTQMGRLVADPERKQTSSGISLVNFTIAVDRPYKNNGEKKADFIRCQAWRQTAEFISKYFSKGKMILIEGAMQNNDYEKDGIKHYSYVVLVNNVYFCGDAGGKGDNAGTPSNTAASALVTASTVDPVNVDLNEFETLLSDPEVPF